MFYLLFLGVDEVKRKKFCVSEDIYVLGCIFLKRFRFCEENSIDDFLNVICFILEVFEDVEIIIVILESCDLWDCFNELGIEMIIIKLGR